MGTGPFGYGFAVRVDIAEGDAMEQPDQTPPARRAPRLRSLLRRLARKRREPWWRGPNLPPDPPTFQRRDESGSGGGFG
jgi:hypothetical protein